MPGVADISLQTGNEFIDDAMPFLHSHSHGDFLISLLLTLQATSAYQVGFHGNRIPRCLVAITLWIAANGWAEAMVIR